MLPGELGGLVPVEVQSQYQSVPSQLSFFSNFLLIFKKKFKPLSIVVRNKISGDHIEQAILNAWRIAVLLGNGDETLNETALVPLANCMLVLGQSDHDGEGATNEIMVSHVPH